MDAFQWTPLFETGLAEVDAQHQRLVGLIKRYFLFVPTGGIYGWDLRGPIQIGSQIGSAGFYDR